MINTRVVLQSILPRFLFGAVIFWNCPASQSIRSPFLVWNSLFDFLPERLDGIQSADVLMDEL